MMKTIGQLIDENSGDAVAVLVAAIDRANELEAEVERLRAWAVAAYNARQPITDAALRMVLNVEADSDMTAGAAVRRR